jgi:hypothetical protein
MTGVGPAPGFSSNGLTIITCDTGRYRKYKKLVINLKNNYT